LYSECLIYIEEGLNKIIAVFSTKNNQGVPKRKTEEFQYQFKENTANIFSF